MSETIRGVRRWARKNIVLISVACGPVMLVAPWLLQGKALIWGTPAMQFIPWWSEILRQLSAGQFPLWNSLNGFGAPLLANYQSAVFYPPNWSLLLFGLVLGNEGIAWGFTFLALLHLVWSGWGMVLLVRRCGASEFAQAIAGLAFSLCGYLVARLGFFSMIWTAAWLPWLILSVSYQASPCSQLLPARRFHFSIPLSITLVFMLLAGHAQLSWYGLLLAGTWVLVGTLRRPWRGWFWPGVNFLTASLGAVVLAAVQLIPTAGYLLASQRSAEYGYNEAMTYSFWPWRLLTLMAPDLFGNPGLGDYWGYASYWEDAAYIGLLPLIFALATIPSMLRSAPTGLWIDRKGIIYLWSLVFVGLVLALGQNTPIFPFLYRFVPSFDMFQAPARYMLWVVFALVVLAAIGIDGWRTAKGRGLYWLRLGTAAALAVTLGAGLGWLLLHGVRTTFFRAAALAGLLALGTGSLALMRPFFERHVRLGWWKALVFLWLLADLSIVNWWLNPVVETTFYSHNNPSVVGLQQSLGEARLFLPEAVETELKFRSYFRSTDYRPIDGWDPLRAVVLPNMNLLDELAMANNFDPLVDARYEQWMQTVNALEKATQMRWLALAGVGAVTRLDQDQPDGVSFDIIEPVRTLSIHACPLWVEGGEEALDAFIIATNDPRTLVLESHERTQSPGDCEAEVIGWGNYLERKPGQLRITTQVKRNGWLWLNESWSEGWVARVDGKETKPLRANYLFMAIPVPAGEHEITLQYHPLSFAFGGLLSILGTIGIFFYIAFNRLQRKSRMMDYGEQ